MTCLYSCALKGVKPAALGKVQDPEVRTFFERCIGPAIQWLPANKLLMDPFLQWDSQIHSFPLPDVVIPKGGAFGDLSCF